VATSAAMPNAMAQGRKLRSRLLACTACPSLFCLPRGSSLEGSVSEPRLNDLEALISRVGRPGMTRSSASYGPYDYEMARLDGCLLAGGPEPHRRTSASSPKKGAIKATPRPFIRSDGRNYPQRNQLQESGAPLSL
jgi:hypothetical protein